ncbi:MAG: hypothetical protein IKN27_09980 [Selenomonadaceae bacterium]|nr:hypothetical protein [Selenomonadaceae bacterium]
MLKISSLYHTRQIFQSEVPWHVNGFKQKIPPKLFDEKPNRYFGKALRKTFSKKATPAIRADTFACERDNCKVLQQLDRAVRFDTLHDELELANFFKSKIACSVKE